MSLGLGGSGGAGPERPFLLVWVLGDARAVWWFFGDGVLVIRSCDLLLVWGLAPSRFLLMLGGSRGSGGVAVRGSVPGVPPGCRYGASLGSPSSGCLGRRCIVGGRGGIADCCVGSTVVSSVGGVMGCVSGVGVGRSVDLVAS